MADSVNPGPADPSPLGRRVSHIERFLQGLSRKKIRAKDNSGSPTEFDVLAHQGGSVTDNPDSYGAFHGLKFTPGKVIFQGGTVQGTSPEGGQTVTIKDMEVVSSTIKPADMEGKVLWLEITFSAEVRNGTIIPGGKVTAARCDPKLTVGKEVPNSTYPTKDSPTGRKIYFEVGRWTKEGFAPSSSSGGNYLLTWCPGNFIVQRI
jgi:hypothetical protein